MTTTSTAAATRTVRIEPLSARTELLLVVRVGMAIVAGVWIYLASHVPAIGDGATGRRNLLPFQKLVADRPSDEQRMFRELQEGLLEAEGARSRTASWPTAPALAADGIPPFAADPTTRRSYAWQMLQSGTIVNYLGLPKSGDAPAWLLLVQEPQPGVPPDQSFEDEEHHRLADGAMRHVSTWVHADGQRIAAHVVRQPQAEGWTQLYAVGPSATPAR